MFTRCGDLRDSMRELACRLQRRLLHGILYITTTLSMTRALLNTVAPSSIGMEILRVWEPSLEVVYGRSEKHMPQDSTHPLVHMQGTLRYQSIAQASCPYNGHLVISNPGFLPLDGCSSISNLGIMPFIGCSVQSISNPGIMPFIGCSVNGYLQV
ncbi:uncharacterized protein MYCFIDRAFT_173614 [Pseudocercospora fijiensis CIRAD86]|uniref:Uncharacterized protein n=1 Tax=Pseudocercospora fijiensis (strain CIRAD86) TaxID=383855 RepID=M3AJA4_PSEFD|nr:uncharacterized protein MYCFIDRAFT_173614 [Pseudocercospora fijiensis CIRAD86]EME84666.1 hypothetical protein MYCFIDRAFT_173614 [Pseudocercospora fijiensis CIRAD86]